jgi:outer membrane immunogenic protein
MILSVAKRLHTLTDARRTVEDSFRMGGRMKKVFLTAAAFGMLALPAMAADIAPAPRPVYKAPIPVPACIWCGWYVGVNAGGTFGGNNSTTVASSPGSPNPAQINAPIFAANYASLASGVGGGGSNGGFIGGGQIGYNWQFNPSLSYVVGLEADFQGLGANTGSASSSRGLVDQFGNSLTTTTSVQHNLDYLGTVRGRIGFLVNPALLVFGSGGLAYGGIKSSTSVSQTISNTEIGPAFTSGSLSDTRVGWTLGAGAEWMFLSNWSAKVEYLYYDLGGANYGAGISAPLLIAPAAGAGSPLFSNPITASTRFNGNIVRAGVNWHF